MLKKEILIVDGYNMIGAWPELVKLKNQDLIEESRDQLLQALSSTYRSCASRTCTAPSKN